MKGEGGTEGLVKLFVVVCRNTSLFSPFMKSKFILSLYFVS